MLLPLALIGVLGLAAVVLVHEVAEVVVIANGMRAARTRGEGRAGVIQSRQTRSAKDITRRTHRMSRSMKFTLGLIAAAGWSSQGS